jgi:hypothetical protein
MGVDIIGTIFKNGVGAVGSAIGGLAKDVRTAITGKESITSEERQKILDSATKMEELALAADQVINNNQQKLNELDAQSTSLFRSGWRPAVGWICVSGLGYQFLFLPIFPWAANIISHTMFAFWPKIAIFSHHVPALPPLEMGTLMTLLLGLLGLGGMRTFEKVKGIN